MSPQHILALIQLGKFALETVEAYQGGTLSEEEAATRWSEITAGIDEANRLWEKAGK